MNDFKPIYILIPVYDDWKSLNLLIEKISGSLKKELFDKIKFVIVNDCSTLERDLISFEKSANIQIIHLNRNIGHQKAIVVGLAYIADNIDENTVIVMDADGEDRPEDLERLIDASEKNPKKIIFASRIKRHESFIFKIFYRLYKIFFWILTGKVINFGNFCIIPYDLLKKLIYLPEIWNHVAGGVILSKLEYDTIPAERGKRLSGRTQMNFSSLILHGLSSIAVHIEPVAIRLIIIIIFPIIFSVVSLFIVTGIRLFTDMAIPGWATSTAIGLIIVLVQSFLIILFLIFMVLNYRLQKPSLPAIDYKEYILKVEKLS